MKRKSLVISDDPLVRNLASSLLTMRKYDVDQAASLEEAEELLARERYEFAVLDLTLSGNRGLEAWQRLVETGSDSLEHSILLTNGTAEFIRRLPEGDWCAMLVKPFTIGEFYRVVELCSGESRGRIVYH